MAEKDKTNYSSYMFYGYGVNEGEAYLKRAQVMDTEEVEGVVDEKIDKLKGNAPSNLDSIEELAEAVQNGGGDVSDLVTRIGELEASMSDKVDSNEVETMINTAVGEKTENLFNSVEYDSNEKKIVFKNEAGNQVGEINASDFIKDGMVNDVKVEDGKLVISFNEDGGNDAVELDLSEIFNASNYYTANECDEKYQEKGNYALVSDIPNLDGYATEEFVTAKIGELEIPTIENILEQTDDMYQEKGDYATKTELSDGLSNKMDNVELADVATTGSYNDLLDTPSIPSLDDIITMDDVIEQVNQMDFLTEHQPLDGLFSAVEYVSAEKKINFKDKTDTVVGSVDTTDFVKDGMVDDVTVDENNNLVITFNTDSGKESVSVSLGTLFDPNNYFTTTQSDARYYQQDAANEIFVAKTTLDGYSTTEQMDDAIENAVESKANKNDIDATINALVIRLNKLEATNNYLIEHNTDSAETINNMSVEDAENAEITVSTNEAIAALTSPKTFKSINVVGGELGDNTVITLRATDEVNVSGLTVSGTQGSGNGKINYATNEINIETVNIEPGCTVYNVFEGAQDRVSEHSVDKFTAKNVVVNDTDLIHNVFNIYQFNDNAEVLISDSSFNMNVANSNVLRVSNITNAKNVTVTFKNIDLTYENKPYTDEDVKWAGLVIYQPYGNDAAFAGDTSNTQTWTFNFINCRYNGELVTENEIGTIKQLIYQYRVNNQGCEAPSAFGTINISVE